jgi:hypothetical protein
VRALYRFIALSLCALLMACATTSKPAVQVITQEVKVPVPVACVDAKAVPAEPARVGDKLNGQAAHDADLLASSALLLRQWGRELRALVQPCLKP